MQTLKLVTHAIILFSVFSHTPAAAEQQFYRCVVNGKTTYTDKPCDAPTLPGVDGASAPQNSTGTHKPGTPTKPIELDYSTPYGIWRGQAQYQGTTVKGKPLREAHVVVPLVIEVEKQGRVLGASPENGCKLLGVAAPHVAPHMLALDVTLSECRYQALNRRYSGMLILGKASNSVQFSLRSLNPVVAVLLEGPTNLDIKATMKR